MNLSRVFSMISLCLLMGRGLANFESSITDPIVKGMLYPMRFYGGADKFIIKKSSPVSELKNQVLGLEETDVHGRYFKGHRPTSTFSASTSRLNTLRNNFDDLIDELQRIEDLVPVNGGDTANGDVLTQENIQALIDAILDLGDRLGGILPGVLGILDGLGLDLSTLDLDSLLGGLGLGNLNTGGLLDGLVMLRLLGFK